MSVNPIDNGRNQTKAGGNQPDKFAAAARDLGCDEDESRWEANLRKVATHKPAPEADEKPEKGRE